MGAGELAALVLAAAAPAPADNMALAQNVVAAPPVESIVPADPQPGMAPLVPAVAPLSIQEFSIAGQPPRWNLSTLGPSPAAYVVAQEEVGPNGPVMAESSDSGGYSLGRLGHHAGSIPLELAGVGLTITALGVFNWDWGSSGFHFNSEGWFGKDTSSFGQDKLGHAYSTYLITELFLNGIRREAKRPRHAPLSAAILAMGMMTYVEIFDGISEDHGFSWEDLVADAAGAAFSMIRGYVPGLKDKLDFRLHYIPSGNLSGFHPITDYSGQRYILALQLGGFSGLKESPLRFIELHAGYMARGFTEEEKMNGEKPRRVPFVGVGLNLQQLLFPHPRARWQRMGRSFLDYVQVPYTAIYSDQLKKN